MTSRTRDSGAYGDTTSPNSLKPTSDIYKISMGSLDAMRVRRLHVHPVETDQQADFDLVGGGPECIC